MNSYSARMRAATMMVLTATLWCQVPAANPALGRKLDNFLNHNLPFLSWVESVEATEWSEMDPYVRYMLRRESSTISIGVEYYDEMDAEEKAKVDANNQLETAFGWMGGAITGGLLGGKAAKVGAKAAEWIGLSTFGQWFSGALGAASMEKPGEVIGSY